MVARDESHKVPKGRMEHNMVPRERQWSENGCCFLTWEKAWEPFNLSTTCGKKSHSREQNIYRKELNGSSEYLKRRKGEECSPTGLEQKRMIFKIRYHS